ncbi:related to isotrichodermin C-15 hydroxylase (cytochrome P-450 monooxygenase CYP65A1) [Rhynchosporium secalis]|uniref:Related to isotrichodermin C-15 hydroxylase (Cytochrome P-450 monooxygenase CYP65A1) n=1 Tax=Rhynchosporium secalis TaxID=38038 RepID=A0A1E1MK98_RHYSE|nr:related to isotrichodermin C-15 hydroxylase (cytochrome P-450 monooxygenase CYP65A1) [Rhynchosporium secalis]
MVSSFTKKTVAVSSVATALIVFQAPHLLPERLSRAVVRFLIYDGVLAIFYTLFIYPFLVDPLRHLPGPKSYNFLYGNGLASFSKPPGQEILNWVNDPKIKTPEGIIRFRGFFNRSTLVPTSVEALKSVLSDHTYDFIKPKEVSSFLTLIIGDGLILTEGDVHKFQRKNTLPAFQLKSLKELYPVFWSKTRGLVEGIEADIDHLTNKETNKEPVIEFGEWATRVTLDIIGLAGMGRDFNAVKNADDELVQAYTILLDPTIEKAIYFATNILGPQSLVQKLPWKQNADLKRVTGQLKSYCLKNVREKREEFKKTGKLGKDILSLLIESNNFNDQELVDQMLTFLAAGHETTSSAMTWAVWLLATHPDWQHQLREEVRGALPSVHSDEMPTVAQIEDLPILNAVVNETLRLYPTVPMTVRKSIRDTHIGNVPIPDGTRVLLVPWAINRSTHLWGEDSEVFKPERWLAEGCANTGGAKSNYAQITFLHGPRSCIGMGFSKAEFKCLLAGMVGAFDLEMADPNEKVWPAGVITTKPAHGMHLHIKKLQGW